MDIINGDGLARAMKEAYRRGGYRVAVEDIGGEDWVYIWCGYWATMQKREDVNRKVLGLIAQHIGLIPEEGQAFHTWRSKEAVAQAMIFADAERQVKAFMEMGGEFNPDPCAPTALTLGGNNIWQNTITGKILIVDPAYQQIIETKDMARAKCTDRCLIREDWDEKAWILCIDSEAEQLQRMTDHLAAIRWTKTEET